MTGQSVRVLCVDDNWLVASSVKTALTRAGHQCVGVLSSADALEAKVLETTPQVVVLDLDMPGRSALHALKGVADSHPDVRIIVLSGHVRRELIDQAFEAGAWGYLSKTDGVAQITDAVATVMAGDVVMSDDVRAVLGA